MNTIEPLEQVLAELKRRNCQTRILAVSKLQPIQKIQTLYNQGQRLFAENYVQEAVEKQLELQNLAIHWHFIGRLQKNKVKQVVGKFDLIHSVDSVELTEVINRKAQENSLQQRILLQINLSEEDSKGGFSPKIFLQQLPRLTTLSSVKICGLMTMPPLFNNPEMARPFFIKLKNIFEQIKPDFPDLQELSMGTSSDYLIAAEEGATLVRLGTILFGSR